MTLSWAVTARSGQHLDRQLPQETLSIVTEVMVTHSHSCQRKCSVKECFVLASEVGMCIFFLLLVPPDALIFQVFILPGFWKYSAIVLFFFLSLLICVIRSSHSPTHIGTLSPPPILFTSPPHPHSPSMLISFTTTKIFILTSLLRHYLP